MQCSTDASFKCFKWQMSSLKSNSLALDFSTSSSSTYICSPLCSSSTRTLPGSILAPPLVWLSLIAAQNPPRCTSQTFSPRWLSCSPLNPFSCDLGCELKIRNRIKILVLAQERECCAKLVSGHEYNSFAMSKVAK